MECTMLHISHTGYKTNKMVTSKLSSLNLYILAHRGRSLLSKENNFHNGWFLVVPEIHANFLILNGILMLYCIFDYPFNFRLTYVENPYTYISRFWDNSVCSILTVAGQSWNIIYSDTLRWQIIGDGLGKFQSIS